MSDLDRALLVALCLMAGLNTQRSLVQFARPRQAFDVLYRGRESSDAVMRRDVDVACTARERDVRERHATWIEGSCHERCHSNPFFENASESIGSPEPSPRDGAVDVVFIAQGCCTFGKGTR